MNDRELLEKAAKAAGFHGWQSKRGYWNMTTPDGESIVCCANWPKFDPNTGEELNPTFAAAVAELNWNPLTDDGDALWLAVKLNMAVSIHDNHCTACAQLGEMQTVKDMPTAEATRRAIVRAAAAIGESK
jgi:hypothetical protein